MLAAREIFGRPGISIMLPAMATTKPAPLERLASVTLRVQPVGAPIFFGSSEREYCVFAIQTGSFAIAPFGVLAEFCARLLAEGCARAAVDVDHYLADFFFQGIFWSVDRLRFGLGIGGYRFHHAFG